VKKDEKKLKKANVQNSQIGIPLLLDHIHTMTNHGLEF